MRCSIDINYENDISISENQDPRKQLEEFVIGNLGHINYDQIRELAPDLSAHNEKDWVVEFVRANNPYEVLQNCFYEDDLKTIAKDPIPSPIYPGLM